MEEPGADCAVAFAEAQRWVEVSAFTLFRTSLRPRGHSRRFCASASSRDWRRRVAAGWFAVWGTLQVLLLLPFKFQLSLVLPSLRRVPWLPRAPLPGQSPALAQLGLGTTHPCAPDHVSTGSEAARGPRERFFGGGYSGNARPLAAQAVY